MLSKQEIFDRGLAHIRQQGKKCSNDTTCLYSDGQGNKCIVGGFIPDNDYEESFDSEGNSGVFSMVQNNPKFAQALAKQGIDVKDVEVVDLLRRMQRAHDFMAEYTGGGAAKSMASFEVNMARVAQNLELHYSRPT